MKRLLALTALAVISANMANAVPFSGGGSAGADALRAGGFHEFHSTRDMHATPAARRAFDQREIARQRAQGRSYITTGRSSLAQRQAARGYTTPNTGPR
jgi:hypothetical protein